MHIVQYTLYTEHCSMHIVKCNHYTEHCALGFPDMHNIQPCEQIFGTVMYSNHTEPNDQKIFYGLNFEALHRVFVLQWELQ